MLTTAIVYDERMLEHEESGHPECPDRIKVIYDALNKKGLLDRCVVLKGSVAKKEEILSVHKLEHFDIIANTTNLDREELDSLEASYNSIYLNNKSYQSALVAAGSTTDLCNKVVSESFQNGIAIVRPPGHHASKGSASGFCIFNNVAVAAQNMLDKGVKRIVILDLDVHHGDGTQSIFIKEDRVLYISIHRYDNGRFYPGISGNPSIIGEGKGIGKNVNIGLNTKYGVKISSNEYAYLYLNMIEPMIAEYNPELIILSAGFDCIIGDPLGGLQVVPEFYGFIVKSLKCFVNSKIVICLEGGYNLGAISKSMVCCCQALLGDHYDIDNNLDINLTAIDKSNCAYIALETTKNYHKTHWKFLLSE